MRSEFIGRVPLLPGSLPSMHTSASWVGFAITIATVSNSVYIAVDYEQVWCTAWCWKEHSILRPSRLPKWQRVLDHSCTTWCAFHLLHVCQCIIAVIQWLLSSFPKLMYFYFPESTFAWMYIHVHVYTLCFLKKCCMGWFPCRLKYSHWKVTLST